MPSYASKWPEYATQWDIMKIDKDRLPQFQHYADVAIRHQPEYMKIQEATGVPWQLIAVLHRRESDANFKTYLGNGDPLNKKTVNVPAGRGPFKDFVEGAIDALRYDKLDKVVRPWPIEKVLYHAEKFNGWGYSNKGKPSPYLWGGTNIQEAGKYVADGKWSSTTWDKQPGCAPILWLLTNIQNTQYMRET